MAVSEPKIWIENTTSQFDHGGPGWEFGKCIWCPARDKRGSEGRYKIIREVKAGDLVINCYDGILRGASKARNDCYTTADKPPNPGSWSFANSFNRFDLDGFREFATKERLSTLAERFKDDISREIETDHPSYHLFSWWPKTPFYPSGRVVVSQGRFLARATLLLCRKIDELVGLDAALFGEVLKK